MSIAVLTQVYDEARRLAVAGSVVARGDFRLKKLLPPLEQAGAKAPVFAKVAECARAVIDGPDDTSAESLLELTSLVTAVLYTQGETGVAGPLEPIESVDLGGAAVQTSARLLKPLLEALGSTGSGRLELIRDAHERGAFRDLRLVKPALTGLDDPYAEIADFLATQVLPMYGRAILPELRAKYQPKGTKGDARRLTLMHAIDPAGSRELVKAALDGGSKEVKVAAVGCLGADPEDVAYLIDQTGAKAHDVRAAAYRALASIDDPAAVSALENALAGKDAGLAAAAIGRSAVERLTALLVAEAGKASATLAKAKDAKAIGELARRLVLLIRTLPAGAHPAADKLTLDLFARRGELAKIKGDDLSGSDVAEAAIARMASGPTPLQAVLARAHADLPADHLWQAFEAARKALSPVEVFDLFSPYLLATGGKKSKDAAKREVLLQTLGTLHVDHSWNPPDDGVAPFDPRWLDLAVHIKHVILLHHVGRPDHPAAEAFLRAELAAALKAGKAKNQQLYEVVTAMVHTRHPDAAAAVAAAALAVNDEYLVSGYAWQIPMLPKDAIPQLEAVTPRLKGYGAERWVAAIQELREKP
ncbi:MAG: HEAT repeat domain-containing protein [Gemmataceae bacterium]